jgi:hypothetical protein
MSQAQAFLSYTRLDDEFFGGSISGLRGALELGVRVVTGDKTFQIFQDIDGIELGQQWQKRLDEAVSGARFLIPIITPLFFGSDACRDELKKFIDHESEAGRDDLILPVYFVTTPLLERRINLRQMPLLWSLANVNVTIGGRMRISQSMTRKCGKRSEVYLNRSGEQSTGRQISAYHRVSRRSGKQNLEITQKSSSVSWKLMT